MCWPLLQGYRPTISRRWCFEIEQLLERARRTAAAAARRRRVRRRHRRPSSAAAAFAAAAAAADADGGGGHGGCLSLALRRDQCVVCDSEFGSARLRRSSHLHMLHRMLRVGTATAAAAAATAASAAAASAAAAAAAPPPLLTVQHVLLSSNDSSRQRRRAAAAAARATRTAADMSAAQVRQLRQQLVRVGLELPVTAVDAHLPLTTRRAAIAAPPH